MNDYQKNASALLERLMFGLERMAEIAEATNARNRALLSEMQELKAAMATTAQSALQLLEQRDA